MPLLSLLGVGLVIVTLTVGLVSRVRGSPTLCVSIEFEVINCFESTTPQEFILLAASLLLLVLGVLVVLFKIWTLYKFPRPTKVGGMPATNRLYDSVHRMDAY